MQPPPLPANEDSRLRRLKRLGVLDSGSEAVLDDFTELAVAVTGMPIALISLVDQDRQWWKSAVGLPQGGSTPREVSFCGHAVAGEGLFEVEDATRDARFADNPIVVGAPRVIHYAGMPLVMPDGEHIGTICVIEDKPGRLDDRNRAFLERLAKSIVSVLLLRESERDLGAKVRAEAALRESEAKFRTITDAMPQMVWSADAQGHHDYYNQRWYDFTGMARGGAAADAWADLFHPDDRDHARSTWQRSLASGEPYEIEYRLRHTSGEFRWVLGRALPVRDDAGRVVRWMGTCTDIHDRKLAQAELHAANRRKDEFLAMLAHELRNPLAPISTASQLLKVTAEDPARVIQTSELIGRQVKLMTTLVDDLLDVSRVTRGLVKIADEVIDLKQVVHSALEQARPHIESYRHALQVHLSPEAARVRGDRVRLIQVISNLLNNAAKYTPRGGSISVELTVKSDEACIAVSDTGSGIDPGLLPYVFDLFTQAERTPDRAQGGLGLGLTLVKSLVELHGGHVEAHSPGRGHGSTFTVCLPLTQAQVVQAGPESNVPVESGRSLRMMVVDDNADAAHSIGAWLGTLGHKVAVHTDAATALAAAQREPAEVYVLDIGLPGMDGYELARRLRGCEAGACATLLALTGYGQAHDIASSRDAGFDQHFVKPVDPVRFADELSRLATAVEPQPVVH